MRVTLRELRELISFELALNELDVARLAKRASEGKGLRYVAVGTSQLLIALVSKEGVPKVVGSIELHRDHNFEEWTYRVDKIWADDPSAALYLLAGALEMFHCLVPDLSMSPASKAVVRRYYEANKDDPSKVTQGYDTERVELNEPDYLKAAYLGPIGFDLETALEAGKQIAPDISEKDLLHGVKQGFRGAYYDIEKTGTGTLLGLLKRDPVVLIVKLRTMVRGGGKTSEKVTKFVAQHEDEIRRQLQTIEEPSSRAHALKTLDDLKNLDWT